MTHLNATELSLAHAHARTLTDTLTHTRSPTRTHPHTAPVWSSSVVLQCGPPVLLHCEAHPLRDGGGTTGGLSAAGIAHSASIRRRIELCLSSRSSCVSLFSLLLRLSLSSLSSCISLSLSLALSVLPLSFCLLLLSSNSHSFQIPHLPFLLTSFLGFSVGPSLLLLSLPLPLSLSAPLSPPPFLLICSLAERSRWFCLSSKYAAQPHGDL